MMKLTYSWQRVFRERTRLETFTITLVEEKKDTLEGLSRQVERLLKKVEQQEERIASLEKENSKLKSDADQALLEKLEMVEMNQKNAIPQVKEFMEKTLQDFEKAVDQKFVSIDEKFKFLDKTIVQIIEEFIPKMKEATEKTLLDFEKRLSTKVQSHDEELKTQTVKERAEVSPGTGDWEFDTSGFSVKYYIFSNERNTVQYDTTGVSKAIFATRQLLMTQKDKFSVRVEEVSSSGNIMIGICPKALRTLEKVSDRRGVYCYFGGSNYHIKSQGFMYISGSSSGLTNCGLTKGAIITIAMDPQTKTVSFDLNGNQIYSGSISLLSDSDEYYPFLEMSNKNDKVSFI